MSAFSQVDALAAFSVCVLVGGFGFGWVMGYRAAKEDGMAGKKYDSTIARMAGNMAADLIRSGEMPDEMIAQITVRVARAIVQEVIRTTPAEE